jgi:hypothetical protein
MCVLPIMIASTPCWRQGVILHSISAPPKWWLLTFSEGSALMLTVAQPSPVLDKAFVMSRLCVLQLSALAGTLAVMIIAARAVFMVSMTPAVLYVPINEPKTDWVTLPDGNHPAPFSAVIYPGPGDSDLWVIQPRIMPVTRASARSMQPVTQTSIHSCRV